MLVDKRLAAELTAAMLLLTSSNSRPIMSIPRLWFWSMPLLLTVLVGCGGDHGTSPRKDPVERIELGPEGGVLSSGDARAVLTVPADALTEKVAVSVEPAQTCPPGAIGQAYSFLPAGLTFDPPAMLMLTYDRQALPAGTDEATLAIGKAVDGVWQRLDNSVVDRDAGTVTVALGGFSVYGVIAGHSGEQPLGDPAVWDAVNTQICQVLDAAREVHLNTLLMLRGLERDFSVSGGDPGDYDDAEVTWMTVGMSQAQAALEEFITQAETLQSLEEGVAARMEASGKTAWSGKKIANWLIRKGLGDFGKKLTMVEDELRELIYEYAFFLVEESLDVCSGNLYCDDLKSLNCILRSVSGGRGLGRKPWLEENWDETVENAEIIWELSWPRLANINSQMLAVGGCATYRPIYQAFLNETMTDLCWEGMKCIADSYMKINKDRLQHSTGMRLGYRPKAAVTIAHPPDPGTPGGVVILVPVEDEFDELPIVVAAPPDEDGSLYLPEVYEGTYDIYVYRRGAYPSITENVTVRQGASDITISASLPLEGIEPGPFPAELAGDPSAALNPPPFTCVTCELVDSYAVEYRAQYVFTEIPFMVSRVEAETAFSFDIVDGQDLADTVVVEDRMTARLTYLGGDGFVYTPAEYDLTTTFAWTIVRRVVDGRESFSFAVEIIEPDQVTVGCTNFNNDPPLDCSSEVDSGVLPYLLSIPAGATGITMGYDIVERIGAGADFELIPDLTETQGTPGTGSYFHAFPDPNVSGSPMQYREIHLRLKEE